MAVSMVGSRAELLVEPMAALMAALMVAEMAVRMAAPTVGPMAAPAPYTPMMLPTNYPSYTHVLGVTLT